MLGFANAVRLIRDRKDGGYAVSCRDIPEAITQGESAADTLCEAEGALQAAIEGRVENARERLNRIAFA